MGCTPTTQLSYTQFSYDGNAYGVAPTTRGNLTLVHQQKDASTFIDTSYEYNDAYGNRTASVDPNVNRTEYVFDASTHAQPTTITVYPDRLDTNNKHITSILYDASTGLVLSQTDPNGKTTDTDYTNQVFKDASQVKIDPYGRPGVVTDPQGRTAVTRYVDHLTMMNVTADLKIASDAKLKSQTSYDMLGRVIKTESNEGGSSYTISSDTVYKYKLTGGQIVFTSNPHRSTTADTDGWTRATHDELGRVVEVVTFSGATQPADTGTTNTTGVVTTSYVTNQVTVTDQDLKTRRSTTDALGRLSVVTENPGGSPTYDTSYGYDALGNLLTVTQGAQTRTFTYDMLSRL